MARVNARTERLVVDQTVYKLVSGWLGDFPESLNVSLRELLKMSQSAANRHGNVFARRHRLLVNCILDHTLSVTPS